MVDSPLTRRAFVSGASTAAAGLALGLAGAGIVRAGNPEKADTSKILNYNPDMEYRRCGRTGMTTSCVCLGGHWKRVDKIVPGLFKGGSWLSAKLDNADFEQNRRDVVTRCIERGINHIDACTGEEVVTYAKALKGRRDKMYLHYSWYQKEARNAAWRTFEKLKEGFDAGLKEAGLDYVDVWRITCFEQSTRHTDAEMEAIAKVLEWAKKSGRARFTGISSHDQPHIKRMIETHPQQMEVIVTPYTAKTKVVDDPNGLWAAMRKHDVGWFGIKPFASGSVFQGDSSPGNPHEKTDNEMARLIIRYILCNPAITAPIPGMITMEQVDNMALAVLERRELDLQEKAQLDATMDRAWAQLPYHYQWLKNWETV